IRRAERYMTEIAYQEPVNPAALKYANRLSDLLFVLARYLNRQGQAEIRWRPACTAAENVLKRLSIVVPMSLSHFAVPAEDRYFEDYVPGSAFEFGEVRVDQAEIIEFARRFDPQDMHVDPEKAASGRFGGLIASGWHTAALMMRLLADNFLPREASLASPGI